jgi:hypothetical protein
MSDSLSNLLQWCMDNPWFAIGFIVIAILAIWTAIRKPY